MSGGRGSGMTPADVQVGETLAFVLRALPNGGSSPVRVLEVGCGDGALAQALQSRGHDVVAVDSSSEAVTAARRRGVDARLAVFPDFTETPFEAVMFTRSLHHLHPVHAAVDRAHQLLRPAGLVLVEDFDFEQIHVEAASWLHSVLRSLDARGVLLPSDGKFGRYLLDRGGDAATWADHAGGIATLAQMKDALATRFAIESIESAPYLYRYVAAMVTDDAHGGEIVGGVLALEQDAVAKSPGLAIGRRIVARRIS